MPSLGRLDPAFVLAWGGAVLLGALAAVVELRALWRAGAHPGTRVLAVLAALVPQAAFGLTLLTFGTGRHPLAQYNADADGQAWFAAWSRAWPLLLLGLLGALVACGVFASRRLEGEPRGRSGWLLLVLACLVGLYGVLQNVPDC